MSVTTIGGILILLGLGGTDDSMWFSPLERQAYLFWVVRPGWVGGNVVLWKGSVSCFDFLASGLLAIIGELLAFRFGVVVESPVGPMATAVDGVKAADILWLGGYTSRQN